MTCINNVVTPQVLVASFQVLVAEFKRADSHKAWKNKNKNQEAYRKLYQPFSATSLS